MRRTCLTLSLLASCGGPARTGTSAADAQIVYAAAAEFGAQPSGADAGMLYAFVKIEGPAHLALEGVTIGHDGGICAEPTEPAKLASIAAITEPDRALTVDALKQGVPFAGALAGGTTYLRISASMDHMCGSETSPTIGIRLRIDGKRVELMRPLDKRLPS